MSNALRIGNRSISYEQAKEMLFPELIPQKGNEAMLSTVPHEKVEDMAVVFRLDLHSESGMMMSTRVNQAILDGFGVTADQIKQDALENAPHTHPASLRSMQEVLGEMMGGFPVPGPDPGQPTLYVATMESMNRGAGVLAYPGFLDEAAEKLGGSFFILPSSIHELLFLQDNGTMDRHELTAMVRSINAAEVSPEDQLSDNVYHYDGKDRVFELAEKYDARKAERQTERPSVLQALKEKSEAARPQPMHARAARAGKEEVL